MRTVSTNNALTHYFAATILSVPGSLILAIVASSMTLSAQRIVAAPAKMAKADGNATERLVPTRPGDEAILAVSVPARLDFSATQGDGAIFSEPIVIRNTGKDNTNLEWLAASSEPWLALSPGSGNLLGARYSSSRLAVNPAGLGVGRYVATLAIRNLDQPDSLETLTVKLTVNSPIPDYPVLDAERTFPDDSGMINVKTRYGAKGDGVTDDTAALQAAISRNVRNQNGAILYFPSGIYLLSSPLIEKDLAGAWQSGLTFQGENQQHTILRLTNDNPTYQSSSRPQNVLTMGSLEPINPHDGGGNNGFDNYIFDMTIDTGRGNPGAVALDFMGNNYCGLRNVTLKSSDLRHVGAIGLSMLRYAPGPCLMKNVVINGFDRGIAAGNTEYSATFEGLTLLNQRVYGIHNNNDVLSIRGLISTNAVPAIHNEGKYGLITLLQSKLQGGSPHLSAIENNGTLYARDVSSAGYLSALEETKHTIEGSTLREYVSGPIESLFSNSRRSLNLPIQETPQFEETTLSNWANVISYGADPTGSHDSSTGVQAAIDSGATTVYFPTGKYLISHTVYIRQKLRMLEGLDSWIEPSGPAFQDASKPRALFLIDAGMSDVTLSHIHAGDWQHSYPGVIFVLDSSSRPVVLLNSYFNAARMYAAYQNTPKGTGSVFLEDVATLGSLQIRFPQYVFARQLNPESNVVKLSNDGGTLWILGFKSEQAGTNIETKNGGSTELLGGLVYPVQTIPVDQSAFVIDNARASFVYAVSDYSPLRAGPSSDFKTQVTETQHGVTRTLRTESLPSRGYGVMMPLYAP
jgi:hypothetical protein